MFLRVLGSGEAGSHTSAEYLSRGHLSNLHFQGLMGPAQGQGPLLYI